MPYRVITVLLAATMMLSAQASAPIEAATKAMGLGNVKSIQYSGQGSVFTLGQNRNPNQPWPKIDVESFTTTVDYESPALMIEAMQNKQRIRAYFRDGRAWNVAANNNLTPGPPATASARALQILLTPAGFLRAASANKAASRTRTVNGRKVTEVSFMAGKQRVTGFIGPDNLLERVETTADNPVLGDMPVEVAYSDYKDFGGLKMPGRIVQKDGGYPTADFTVSGAKLNPEVSIEVPANVRDATPPPVRVEAQKIADGVWYLTGGSHHSLAIEFKDQVVAIEAPQNEERSLAVLNEIRRTIPSKPVKVFVNTHHHFDHSGGVRAVAAQNIGIVTHKANEAFYRSALAKPRTMSTTGNTGKLKPKLVTFTDKHVITDGTRTLELHLIQGNPHHDGILMAYLPKEKILVEADVYTPAPPNTPPPATPNPAAVNLYENIQRLKLDVAQIAPIHGRMVPLSELEKAIGKGR